MTKNTPKKILYNDFWYKNTFLLIVRHPIWIIKVTIYAFRTAFKEVYGTKYEAKGFIAFYEQYRWYFGFIAGFSLAWGIFG